MARASSGFGWTMSAAIVVVVAKTTSLLLRRCRRPLFSLSLSLYPSGGLPTAFIHKVVVVFSKASSSMRRRHRHASFLRASRGIGGLFLSTKKKWSSSCTSTHFCRVLLFRGCRRWFKAERRSDGGGASRKAQTRVVVFVASGVRGKDILS